MNKNSENAEIVSKKKKSKLSNGISENGHSNPVNGHANPENGHANPENGHANPALEIKSLKKSSKKRRVSEELVENVIPREKKRKSAPENNDEENGILSESVTEPAKKKKKSSKKKEEQIDEGKSVNGEHSEPSVKIGEWKHRTRVNLKILIYQSPLLNLCKVNKISLHVVINPVCYNSVD